MTKATWPRLVKCDDYGWGLYREKEGEPIQIVVCGDPPTFIGKFQPDELAMFNEIIDMRFPYQMLLTPSETRKAQK